MIKQTALIMKSDKPSVCERARIDVIVSERVEEAFADVRDKLDELEKRVLQLCLSQSMIKESECEIKESERKIKESQEKFERVVTSGFFWKS